MSINVFKTTNRGCRSTYALKLTLERTKGLISTGLTFLFEMNDSWKLNNNIIETHYEFPNLYFQIAYAAWDFNKIYIDEGIRSNNSAVFDPVDKSDKIKNAKNVKFTVLEDGSASKTFKMDTKRQELVVIQELDREKKEIYKMTMEAKERLQK